MYEETDETTNSVTDYFDDSNENLLGNNFSQTSTTLPPPPPLTGNHQQQQQQHHNHHQMVVDQEEISHPPPQDQMTLLHHDNDLILGGYLNTNIDPSTNWLTQHQQQQEDQLDYQHHRNFLNLLNLPTFIPNHPDPFPNKPYIFDSVLHSTTNPSFLDTNSPPPPSSSLFYDPSPLLPIDSALFHLNLPPPQHPPSLLRDLILHQSPPLHPHIDGGYFPSSNSSNPAAAMFGDGMVMVDDDEDVGGGGSRMVCQDGEVFQFGGGRSGDHHHLTHTPALGGGGSGRGGRRKEPKCPKNHVTERQRRQTWNDKYTHLRRLVPNPTKNDRASIVADAIDYIKELNRTVNELKILVEKKRCTPGKRIRHYNTNTNTNTTHTTLNNDIDDTSNGDVENPNHNNNTLIAKPDPEHLNPSSSSFNNNNTTTDSLRSSWLQRKCRDTEVDVRIIDDEVTIKLVQRKKMVNCLLFVSRSLDELRLDLCHVAGGHVGDYYSFLFNSKISEGSCVYASAIANKLIEVVDKQHAAMMIPSSTTTTTY